MSKVMDTGKSTKFASDTKAGLRVTWVGVVANIGLVILKLAVGFKSQSQALIADGIHSLSDLLSDFVTIIGLKWGRKGEDKDHPWGHGRIESFASLIIGFILLAAALAIAFNGVLKLYQHNVSPPTLSAIIAAAISILIKEGLYWYTIKVGRRIRSFVIIGNAWHHRSDALSSVAVLIGVAGAYINPDWHVADTLAAIIVSFFIARVGLKLTWTTFKEVVDTSPSGEVLKELITLAENIEGVREIHDIRARYSGSYILMEMHVVVDPELTVRDGHAIAKKVERTLKGEMDNVTHVIIHVDPYPKYRG